MIAIPIKLAEATQLQASLRVSFWVELYKLYPVRGDEGDEGNEMGFGHGMVDGNEILVLYFFNTDPMAFIRVFCFQGRKGNAAAADERIAGAVDDVTADGADIEFGTKHIGRGVFVDDMLAVHQFNDRDAQGLRQRLQ